MMLPLYLDGLPGCRVVLDEPALRVVMPEKADQLFPLSRISRVVCKGVVEWSMSALLACADAGINLVFLERNGNVRARWLGSCGERQGISQRFLDLLARADGFQLYENWFLSMEKLAARSFARRVGLPEWRDVSVVDLRRRVSFQLSEEQRQAANLLQSLLHSELLIWLTDSGFSIADEAFSSNDLDLIADFSRFLVWDFYPLLFSMEDTAPFTYLAMAELFHARSDRLYLLFRSSFNKLHQFLMAVS